MTRKKVCLLSDGRALVALSLAACIAAGCNKKDDLGKEQGAAPPPVESSKPGACAAGGGTVKDELGARLFPRTAADYCVDPNGETRAYGKDAPGSIDQVCTELFDGECEVYKRFGLQRVVTLRYIDGQGSPGTISVNLSRFADKDGAYSFFTKRVIADSDPAQATLTDLKTPGAGAMGTGIAYVWRGDHVGELSYTNELESPEQLKNSSQRVLPPLANELAQRLPGEPTPPTAARALPVQHRLPLAISFVKDDVLDVAGAGPGAVGYYKDGEKRWRVFAIVRADEEAAKDVMRTLKKLEEVRAIKPPPIEALTFSRRDGEEGPKIEWAVARDGARVFGVGDESAVLSAGEPEQQNKALRLTTDQKLEHLRALMAAPAGVTADKQ